MKKMIIPKMSEELAELIGIHLGDGSIYIDKKGDYLIRYSLNLKKDKEFSLYVSSQFQLLFGVNLKYSENILKNSIDLRIRSKMICKFMIQCLGIPEGKKDNLHIPYYIKNKRKLIIAFLRGLFDTDGCVTLQKFGRYSYTLVKISTKCKEFAYEIKEGLIYLAIPAHVSVKVSKIGLKQYIGYDVVVRNKNALLFFRVIGSNNKRNKMGTQGFSLPGQS